MLLVTSCIDIISDRECLNVRQLTLEVFLVRFYSSLRQELPKPRSESEIKKENKNILGVVKEDNKSQEKSEIENILLEEIRKK